MSAIVWLLLLGCSPNPMPAQVDPAVSERSLAWVRLNGPGPTAFQTVPVDVGVNIYQNNRRATVILLASTTQGAGPCRNGECLGITAPLQEVGRATGTTRVSIPWTPTAPVGSVVYLQAALLIGDRVVDTSEVWTVTILPLLPGCTRPASPDYDPTANWDDGTCACPESVVAASAAELAPYLGCADLGDVTLTGAHDPVTTFPNLLRAGELVVEGASMTHLSLPALTEAAKLDVRNAPGLIAIDAPSLTTLNAWFAVQDDPSLTSITLPPAITTAAISISGAHQLDDLTLPWLRAHPNGTPMVFVSGDALTRLTLLGADLDVQIYVTEAPDLTTLTMGPIGPGSSVGLAELPSLSTWSATLPRELAEFDLYALPSLPAPDLAGVEHIESGQIAYVQWTSLALPDLASSSSLWFHDAPLLNSISLPSLAWLASLVITDNPALSSLSIPALGDTDWTIGVQGNPAFCATSVPQLAAPPPGCLAYGTDNACDP